MSHDRAIFCSCGAFTFLTVSDTYLGERDRIDLQEGPNSEFCRVVQLPSRSRRIVAVSTFGGRSKTCCVICDLERRRILSKCRWRGDRGAPASVSQALWVVLAVIPSLTVSSNPKLVCGERRCSVFDPIRGTHLADLRGLPEICKILHVPEWESQEVFVGGSAGDLVRYNVETELRVGMYEGHQHYVNGLAASSSQKLLFSGAHDSTIRIWARDEYTCLSEIALSSEVESCFYAEDRNSLLVSLYTGWIEVWDPRRVDLRVRRFRVEGRAEDMDRVDQDRFVSGSSDGSLAIWNPFSGSVLLNRKMEGCVRGVCVGSLSDDPPAPARNGGVGIVNSEETVLRSRVIKLSEALALSRKIQQGKTDSLRTKEREIAALNEIVRIKNEEMALMVARHEDALDDIRGVLEEERRVNKELQRILQENPLGEGVEDSQ